jgi:hypothetical protein
MSPQEAPKRWREIERQELARRVDARFQSRLIVWLPNDMLNAELKAIAQNLYNQIFADYDFLFVVHAGRHRDRPQNLHVHIVYSDRNKVAQKKDRSFARREFLGDIRRVFLAEIAKRHDIAENPESRRLPHLHYITAQKIMRNRLMDNDIAYVVDRHLGEYLETEQQILRREIEDLRAEEAELSEDLPGRGGEPDSGDDNPPGPPMTFGP